MPCTRACVPTVLVHVRLIGLVHGVHAVGRVEGTLGRVLHHLPLLALHIQVGFVNSQLLLCPVHGVKSLVLHRGEHQGLQQLQLCLYHLTGLEECRFSLP
jgi:hypothetical protein